MLKSTLTFGLALMLILSVIMVAGNGGTQNLDGPAVTYIFREGEGIRDNPYLIEDVHDLQALNNDPSANYTLANDIDASETSGWNGGAGFSPISTFTGTFDGQGYVITDLHIYRPDTNNIGLFGNIGETGVVFDVGLLDADITGGSYVVGTLAGYNSGTVSNTYATGAVYGGYRVGGLVGENNPGMVEDSFAVVDVNADDGRIGGLVGFNVDGTVERSYAAGDVVGGWYVGGVVGRNLGGTIIESYATSTIIGSSCVGGLVGDTEDGTISDSYASGTVTGSNWYAGGLIGYVWGTNIQNTYSTGSVSGGTDVGGLIGYRVGGVVSNSFWDIETSGQTTSDGGEGKSTEEMKALSTFADAGWDIALIQDHEDEIWYIDQGNDYPRLWWEEYVEPVTFDIPLFAGGEATGWNFVSFNIIPLDTSLKTILDDIDGNYDRLMYYAADAGEWLTYLPGRDEHFNNLDTWDNQMGLWILMNTDDVLTVTGTATASTDITLYPGWNMVGLPGESSGNHGLPGEVTVVGYFQVIEEYNVAYDHSPGTFIFQPGSGYWIYNGAEYQVTWTVEY